MTVINTNVGALQARVATASAQTNMEKAMQRLSSGLRINSAADDAAGLAVATKMESQIRGTNMAIRNSSDGISLVQTAESGMAEISNMVIRMRELSVQMHNGIYSDGDRSNAQLEITALLEEIDKIASNTAFNGVKVLDGSYDADIRAGDTNGEVIGIQIERMNTDSLGGTAITDRSEAALDPSQIFVHKMADTNISANEGQVRISKDTFNQGFIDFVNANSGGTYSLGSESDAALFSVSQAGIVSVAQGELDFDNAIDANFDNVYEFSVTYTSGSNSVTENIKLTVTDTATPTSAANTATTNLTVKEGENITFEGLGTLGVFSDAMKEFVLADNGAGTGFGTIANTGDQAHFEIDSTGKVTVATGIFDFENPADGATAGSSDGTANNNIYQFTVVYTDGNNKTFTETINVTVTDDATADAATSITTLEQATHGESSMQIQASNATFAFDVNNSLHRDLLSQGAKDFIERHAGTDGVGAGELFVSLNNLTGGATNLALTDNGESARGTTAIDMNTTGGGGVATITSAGSSVSGTATFILDIYNLATIANATESFRETITIDVTQAGASGTNTLVQGSGRTEQVAAVTTMTGTSAGEANVMALTDRTKFADLNTFMDANTSGSFSLFDVSAAAGTMRMQTLNAADAYTLEHAEEGIDNLDSAGNAINDSGGNPQHLGFELQGSNLVLLAGADAGNYKVGVRYTDMLGNTFDQVVDLTTTEASNPSTGTVSKTSTDQTKDGLSTGTTVTGGVSTITVNETMEATIKSTGTGAVLSAQLGQFAAANLNGVYSLSGADASSFEVAKNGDITSRDIMNFEAKAQYNFNLVYTSGDNTYTETIVLNVQNDTSDDGNHIANVDISSQAGALAAVSILDTALNSITAAQAKLGSTQNRLQHNIDNLTNMSSLTETAKGRITDADFATETSNLSKQQILSQAATSMLAQANQSKQSVLALLQ